MAKFTFMEVTEGSKQFALDPESEEARLLASKITWYGPKFSPKDVPQFYDVSSISEDPKLLQLVTDIFVERCKSHGEHAPTHVLGYDARGFIIGPPIAMALGIPFVLFRKDGKNPGVVIESSGYAKEYVEKKLDNMCIRAGSIPPGSRALLIDDLIATGGTALAGFELCLSLGIEVCEFASVIDLPICQGVTKIREYAGGRFKDVPVFTLIDGRTVPAENGRDPVEWEEESRIIPAPQGKAIMEKYPSLCPPAPKDVEREALEGGPTFVEIVPGLGQYALDPEGELAKKFASSITWYGPKFSPKDVPQFYDVSSITEDPNVFKSVIEVFVERYKHMGAKAPTHVLGYDARGFLLGPPIAMALGIPFVLFRKDGKNPGVVIESSGYAKEYVEKKLDNMCLRLGAIPPGSRALLIDDLIATGGTALAGFELCLSLGIEVCEFAAVIDLPVCQGVTKIREYAGGRFKDVPVFTLIDGKTVPAENGRDPAEWEEESRIIPAPQGKAILEKYPNLK